MNETIYLILAGLISGVIGGMGMGGGTLLIPILTLFLQFGQKNAQGINLFVFIPMAIVALVIHVKNKLVDFRVGIPVMISGIVFSILGSLLANLLSNEILRKVFGGFLLLVGIWQGIQTILSASKANCEPENKPKLKFRVYFKWAIQYLHLHYVSIFACQ